jgi:5'(3')-deoxyribonucleotidase
MKKRTIAIDIDDVIADSTESLRLLVNKRWGMNLTKEDYRIPGNYRRYYEHVWQQHGLADKVHYAELEDEMVIDQSHVPIMNGAKDSIHELGKTFRIVFITARNTSWESATREWFRIMFAHENIELYFSEGMSNVGALTKGQLCKKLKADWLIDDNPGHCLTAITEGVKTILFGEYGWHTSDLGGMVRCRNWLEVVEYINDEA